MSCKLREREISEIDYIISAICLKMKLLNMQKRRDGLGKKKGLYWEMEKKGGYGGQFYRKRFDRHLRTALALYGTVLTMVLCLRNYVNR